MNHDSDPDASDAVAEADSYRMTFFGERWDAPAFDDAVEVPVPLGATCLYCTELVDEHDSGILQPAVHGDGTARVEAIHLECHLRSVLGCVPHLEHRCSCYGGGDHDGTSRAAARAVMDWVLTEQHKRGFLDGGHGQ